MPVSLSRRSLLGSALVAGATLSAPHVVAAQATPVPVTGVAGALADAMRAYVDASAFTGAALVARRGEPLLRDAWGVADKISGAANTPETAYQIASLTKAFTATAVVQLATAGKLSLDEPFRAYLPEVMHTGLDGVEATVRNLLSHTAGVVDFFTLYDPGNPMTYPRSFDQLLRDLDGRPLEFTPGTQFKYSNGGYTYAGLIVERVSGEGFEAYLKANVLEPAGLTQTWITTPPSPAPPVARGYGLVNGQEIALSDFNRVELIAAAGGLTSTVDDLLRWHEALLTDRVLPRDAIAEMYVPVLGDYGLGWELGSAAGRPFVGHEGTTLGFRTKLMRFLDDDVVVVLLGNHLEATVTEIGAALAAVVLDG